MCKKLNFSTITFKDLDEVLNIEQGVKEDIFNEWFEYKYEISKEQKSLLNNLISKHHNFITHYSEQELIIRVISPILTLVDFFMPEKNIKDWYDVNIELNSKELCLNGRADFLVATGKITPKIPYFFIQEFKKSKPDSDPEFQLLAEMITTLNLNKTNQIKGAYIIGQNWYFVILNKINEKYEYFISRQFDSMRDEDLEAIFINLQKVKAEILTQIEA